MSLGRASLARVTDVRPWHREDCPARNTAEVSDDDAEGCPCAPERFLGPSWVSGCCLGPIEVRGQGCPWLECEACGLPCGVVPEPGETVAGAGRGYL